MRAVNWALAIALTCSVSTGASAQDIQQSSGTDQRVDYQSLVRFGPWDDRNYALKLEDLEFFSANEEELHPGIPAFFRIELRKEWPHLMKTGPAQYPRAALQLFQIRYGGLMRNGVIERRASADLSRTPVVVNGELKLNDVLEANEVTVEINPVFPLRVIAGSNSSTPFGQKMYFSSDGGLTWGIAAEGTPNGILDNTCCDPTVAWSSNGMIAYAGTLSSGAIGVSFYRSTDFGASWTLSKAITSGGSDKEFIHVDISPASAHKDNIYVTYHDGNILQFARSTDLGLNFTIQSFGSAPPGIGSDITTDSAGNIYYIYASFGTITLLKSTNGGTSFGSPVTVASTNAVFDWPIPSMETRLAWTYAAADADRSGGPFDGNIYAAWTDTSAADSNSDPNVNHTRIVVARSSNGGTNWETSIPHPTGDIDTVDRFNQWMTVDGDGIVHVVYYNTMNSPSRTGVDLYYANSDDGGVTWNAEERISSVTSVNVANLQEWGDYNGISVINGQIVTAWTDNRLTPVTDPDVFAGRLDFGAVDFSSIWVDFGFTGNELGTESNPFNTLSEGRTAVNLGGVVKIKGNMGTPDSTETPTLSKAMILQAVGGNVKIGVPPPPSGEFASTDVPVAIVDFTTVTSTLTVAESFTLNDVNVTLNITHTYDGDLQVELVSPAMTTVMLIDRRGGNGDNFISTVLDDEAATLISIGLAPFSGSFQPEGTLADFDGEDAQGTWTLRITDTGFGDIGSLSAWSIGLNL